MWRRLLMIAAHVRSSAPSTAISVLVVDDSPLMQRIIRKLIESDPRIRVVGTASDGIEAVRKVEEYRPDVVTLDIVMPRLNGLSALRTIMDRTPTPVVVLSAVDEAANVMQALQLGAVEFVGKPSGMVSIDLYKVRDELIGKIKLATFANLSHMHSGRPEVPRERIRAPEVDSSTPHRYVAIGASTGGPRAIDEVVSALPPELPACVLVVQHMPTGFAKPFAERLNRHSVLPVIEAEDGTVTAQGTIYVAPGNTQMILSQRAGRPEIRLEVSPPVHSARPSIDVLMTSVAEVAGPRAVGILMTGMGSDGADGLAQIKAAGGITIAQDRETSTIFGMPRAAIERGVVDEVLPLCEIPGALIRALERTGNDAE